MVASDGIAWYEAAQHSRARCRSWIDLRITGSPFAASTPSIETPDTHNGCQQGGAETNIDERETGSDGERREGGIAPHQRDVQAAIGMAAQEQSGSDRGRGVDEHPEEHRDVDRPPAADKQRCRPAPSPLR